MAINVQIGGKNGVIAVDDKVREFVDSRTDKPWQAYDNDADAKFIYEKNYRTANLEPTVAKPHSPGNAELACNLKDVKLDRSYIGSCTGGKIADFLAAARILKGREVKVPTYIVPATTEVHAELKTKCHEGVPLEKIFTEAGCLLGPASCAACLGGPEDTFGRANEALRCISTTNRNFPGRMGSRDAEIYLASPYTAAASAVTGHITDPREFLG